ncbi:chromosomal replication initiator protein DnaA [Capillimicrobium parvum]|uniref:Chromosomal replication initiator protein DnaA n=1 Tax=Capillimicrobium parvum TaxID=2884022 RepID=A0A9E6XTS0_9ACTN|nr:chromosomal replication initiator protein DnaA [Capillimicrobium parvum]UGS33636.1 Chromosomal replication initiator protein DnaA [Capillimicrobium parvum]
MSAELVHAWSDVRARLQRSVDPSTFAIWLDAVEPVDLTADTLVVAAPDEARRQWIAGRFGRLLQRCAAEVLGPTIAVDVVVAPAGGRRTGAPAAADAGRRDRPTQPPHFRRQHTPDTPAPPLPPDEGAFNPKLTFDQFVIGDGNRLAHGAALAVAEMPGSAYNPLFIYGPPGNGKTHLLHSIGNYVRVYGSGLKVRYVTIESFTNEFVRALHGGGSMDAFKARFRHVDVLLVDDVQFLTSKAHTEEEFFHTFNALHDAGAQLVLTSDRRPRELGDLEDRLRERFEAGLLTDIAAPDRDTRLTILRKRVQHDAIAIGDPGALEVIADRIADSVRLLEGALIRVVAYASMTAEPLTAQLATHVLDELYRDRKPVRRTIEDVQRTICEDFSISPTDLVSSGRTQRLVWPRQLAMYLARELTGQTLPAIGRAFGGRDHTTVLHACRRTAERMATDPDAQRTVRDLTERLSSRS